ncbi:MAG TPA: ABC transporter ATP-binding protein [Candidatus Binataceae bacterium]|nr:ABC transporter ATP-binding protein [Candidatus Binataceae bacterium]
MAERTAAILPLASHLNGTAPEERDARTSDLYASERDSLSFPEALRLLRKGWPFFAAHRRLVILKAAIAISSMLLFLITPWPMKIIIDNIIDAHPLSGIPARILLPIVGTDRFALLTAIFVFLAITVVLTGISGDDPYPVDTETGSGGLDQAGQSGGAANNGWSLWNGLLGFIETSITLELSQRVNQDLRTAIYTRFLRSPLGLYGDQKIGDAVFRVMNDSAAINEVFYRGVLAPIMSITVFFCALVIVTAQFSNEPWIPIGGASLLPLMAIGGALFARVFRDRAQTMRERGSNIMAVFEERLANVNLIKAYGAERRESQNVDRASWSSYSATLKFIAFILAMIVILTPPILLLIIGALYHLFNEVIDKRITLGDVVLLMSYGTMLARPMGEVGAVWANLQAPISGLRRVFSVLDRLNDDQARDGDADPGAIKRIELHNVSIAYDGAPPVVRDVSFELHSGELAALAGPSGAGKTSLINSIPRFIQPCAGEIIVNGIDARRLSHQALRRRIGFVFQQEALFSRSIADNIRYGVPDATDAQMREAARIAGAADFIEALPEKYATVLGRRGARLSVGQKQRIAIARALIRNPDVLVLDEPTAPLDPGSEADLMRTLREIAHDRIVLIVTHRAGTLSECDRIVFASDGMIIAIGSDAELRRSCAPYREYLSIGL